MKNVKHKFVKSGLICAGLAAILSTTAFAATWYEWGPNYWTPYTGEMGAFSTSFEALDLSWSSSQIEDIKSYVGVGFKTLELECRPYSNNSGMETTPVDPNNMWYNPGKGNYDFISTLPSAEAEFQSNDPDDLAITCQRLADIEAETSYYGVFNLEPRPGITFSNRRVLLESEFGLKPLPADSIPVAYEQVFNRTGDSNVTAANTYFGRYYSW